MSTTCKYIPVLDRVCYFDETTGGYARLYTQSDLLNHTANIIHAPDAPVFLVGFNDAAWDSDNSRLYLSKRQSAAGGAARVYRTPDGAVTGDVVCEEYIEFARPAVGLAHLPAIDRVAVLHGEAPARLSFINTTTFAVDNDMTMSFSGMAAIGMFYRADLNRLYLAMSGRLIVVNVGSLSVQQDMKLLWTANPALVNFPCEFDFDSVNDRMYLVRGRLLDFIRQSG